MDTSKQIQELENKVTALEEIIKDMLLYTTSKQMESLDRFKSIPETKENHTDLLVAEKEVTTLTNLNTELLAIVAKKKG